MEYSVKKIVKRPLYKTMDGIIHPASFSPKCFREALDYEPQRNDVIILTYPKCGTTWIQNVVLYIFRKGKELDDKSTHLKLCPYIDMLGLESITKMPRPGALKTHLPLTHLHYSSEAKYIFVARNPKDCVVSFYHHSKMFPGFNYSNGEFDDFFELFMAGEVEYNDYFDHLLSWYPRRNESNVFYTTYESMKTDIKSVILNLARFLGEEYIDAIERDNSVLNNIVTYSGFDYMKNNFSDSYDARKKMAGTLSEPFTYEGRVHLTQFVRKLNLPEGLPQIEFFRKGIVGDWKNTLSENQSERLNDKFILKTKGTDIPNWLSFS